jgi:hypothetical protein
MMTAVASARALVAYGSESLVRGKGVDQCQPRARGKRFGL